ncbi:hypothetical protein JCM8097_001379 [Rhodosporidiobolus ruineniae]
MRSFAATLFAASAALSSLQSASAAPSSPCGVGQFQSGSTCKSCYAPSYSTCSNAKVTGATSCTSGYYLAGGRCMPASSIPAGSYGSADGKVINCGEGVKACSAAGISSCKTSYFLTADKKSCTKTCPDSSFGNTATGACTACASSTYKTCTNARVTSATSCIDGYALKAGRCMALSLVPAGQYVKDGKVYACPTGQKTCTEAGLTTCAAGYTLSTDGKSCTLTPTTPSCPTNGVCDSTGALTSCTNGLYAYEGACVATCPSPSMPYWRGTCVTGTCPTDSFLKSDKTGYPVGTVPSCPQCDTNDPPLATSCYGHTPLGQAPCKPCADPNAATCSFVSVGNGQTLSCKTGYSLDYKNRVCINSCPDGLYYDGYTCARCGQYTSEEVRAGIATCNFVSGATTSCKAGYLYMTESGTCVEGTCPATRTSQDGECVENQIPITDYNCKPTYLKDGQCVPCGNGDANAATCDASGNILTCMKNYSLVNAKCEVVPTCPDNAICDADLNVTGCGSNYYLIDGSYCQAWCPDGEYQDRDNMVCVKTCPNGYTGTASTCYACAGYQGSVLAAGAATCDYEGGKATSCYPGYYFVAEAGACVKECPSTKESILNGLCSSRGAAGDLRCLPTYTSGDQCLPCGTAGEIHAASCNADGTVATCMPGYNGPVDNACFRR